MGWPSWTVHYSQGKGITQTFFPIALPRSHRMCTVRLVLRLITEKSQRLILSSPAADPSCRNVARGLGTIASLGNKQPGDVRGNGYVAPCNHLWLYCHFSSIHNILFFKILVKYVVFNENEMFPSLLRVSQSHSLRNIMIKYRLYLFCVVWEIFAYTWCNSIVIARVPEAAIGTRLSLE